jgi:hypothetical protein
MARALAAVLAAALACGGCAATRRAAGDAAAVATFPLHLVATPVAFLAEGWESDPLSTAATAPVFFSLYAAGDVFFTGVSAADLALTPLHAPFRPGPLDLYDFGRFPPVLQREAVEKAGEAAAGTIVVLAPFAPFVLVLTGHPGECLPPPEAFGPPPGRRP